MWEDPIVAEVHRIREKLAADNNLDLTAYFAAMRKRQASLGNRLVQQKQVAEPAVEIVSATPTGSTGAAASAAVPAT